MPRVLISGFCAVPGPRRAGVQLRHVIRALTPHHSVDLLVSREGDQGYVERQGSVRVLRVPVPDADPRQQVQAFQRALRRQLDGADYDVIHVRDAWAGMPVLEARERFDYAIVYDLARSALGETTGDADLDAQYGRDEEACLLAADMILAPTPAAARALAKPERVVLSQMGVDVDRFDWDDPPKSGAPRILYVGSLDPSRGIRVLVRAMSSIVREMDARLVLAGTMAPKFEPVLRDSIRELGLADKIEVLGAVDHDQVPALIATATVCVVPAAPDLSPNPLVTYPTKLLEYMACKRAVVAPKRETVMHVVDHARDALLFAPGDPVDLARQVLRLLGEPLLRDKLANNAYERVRREHTASASRRQLRNAYDALVDRFADRFDIASADDDSPKVELLADDDFEATVFSEPAPARSDSTSENILVADESDSSPEAALAPPPSPDETQERAPVKRATHETQEMAVIARSRTRTGDDWVVTSMVKVRQELDADSGERLADDGTPIEGVIAAASVLPVVESGFVAGEIDVPTPRPERRDPTLSNPVIVPDADTGNHTPPRS